MDGLYLDRDLVQDMEDHAKRWTRTGDMSPTFWIEDGPTPYYQVRFVEKIGPVTVTIAVTDTEECMVWLGSHLKPLYSTDAPLPVISRNLPFNVTDYDSLTRWVGQYLLWQMLRDARERDPDGPYQPVMDSLSKAFATGDGPALRLSDLINDPLETTERDQ